MEKMQDLNEKKKWLRRYQEAVKATIEIDLEMEELESRYILPSREIDGMPHGSGSDRDLSEFAAKYDELYREIKDALEERIKIRREVRAAIETLENETVKILMLYRYIDGKTWREIAERMNYSYRRATQLHGEALRDIVIPK